MKSTFSRFIIAALLSVLFVLGTTAGSVWAQAKKAPQKSHKKAPKKAAKNKISQKQPVVKKDKDYEINGVFPTVTGADWLAVHKAYKALGKKQKAERALYFSDKLKSTEMQTKEKGK